MGIEHLKGMQWQILPPMKEGRQNFGACQFGFNGLHSYDEKYHDILNGHELQYPQLSNKVLVYGNGSGVLNPGSIGKLQKDHNMGFEYFDSLANRWLSIEPPNITGLN